MKDNKFFNGNQLRLIAVVSMIIDHIGVLLWEHDMAGWLNSIHTSLELYGMWFGVNWILRMVGRIAFPIFAVFLVEGYYHTRDWRRYAAHLLLLAAGSEILFDSVANGVWGMDWSYQGTVFTLLAGLIMLKMFDHFRGMQSYQMGIMAITCLICWLLHTDYNYDGIMLIAILSWYRTEWKKACVIGGIWMAVNSGSVIWAVGYLIAFLLIYRYNGERGKMKISKWVTYGIYPVHLAVLWIYHLILSGFLSHFSV